MSLLSSIIPTAHAASAPASSSSASHGSPWSTIIMLGVFFVIFYFLLIRPQSKRAKAQRALLSSLGAGEEVMTSGGIMGKIITIDENIVTLEIAKGVEIKIQKSAISGTLPKGTVKSSAEI